MAIALPLFVSPSKTKAPGVLNRQTLKEYTRRAPRVVLLFQMGFNIAATLAGIWAAVRHETAVVYSRLEPGIVASWIVAKLMRKPLVLELNGLPSEDTRLFRPKNRLLIYLTRRWETAAYRIADGIVGAPGYVQYVSSHFGVPESKTCVAPLGVNTKVFFPMNLAAARVEMGIPSGPVVAWAGTMSGIQGLSTVVESFRVVSHTMPDARLLLIGDGPSRPAVEEHLKACGIKERVILTGRVAYGSVAKYLACADICLGAFPQNRGTVGSISALKTLTYLACARPVITTRMDELSDVIENSGAGIAVPPDDPSAMASAILQILGEDRLQWQNRCNRAVAMVNDGRTWANTSGRISDYLAALARKGSCND